MTLQAELERRACNGHLPKTIPEIHSELAKIGYRMDRTMDCRGTAKWMTGDHAGETYPCRTTGIVEINTGLSFANVDARRDQNFETLQSMRLSGEWFAISHGSLLEI